MRVMTRRALIRSGLSCCLTAPWLKPLTALANTDASQSAPQTASGLTDTEIILGMSAAFSGPSRGLGVELHRGASAYFAHVNEQGGIAGRNVILKTYDDGYQPDPSIKNTLKLIRQDRVFLLFGYVGTPTVTRVLPMLKKFQDRNIFLFFPFTGAQPQRNLRMETSRLICVPPIARKPRVSSTISFASTEDASPCSIKRMPMDAVAGRVSDAP